MKKFFIFALTSALALSLFGCSSEQTPTEETDSSAVKGTYSVNIGGYDWGAEVNKVTLTLDSPIGNIDKDTFVVSETKMATDFSQAPEFPIEEVTNEKTVLDAYLVDEDGNKVSEDSKYVVIELDPNPTDGSIFVFSLHTMLNAYSDVHYLDISLSETADVKVNGSDKLEAIEIETAYTSKTTDADKFELGNYVASDGIEYNYAYYVPEVESNVLVVWLHGMGEGGVEDTDPYLTSLANKVTSLISDDFQNTIGNAHVLVPQSPTYWMDNDGKQTNFEGGSIVADGTSYYTESLAELIDKYKEDNNIDKVVLTGCSNGGYMTMVLAMTYPEKYDAVVPICEAVADDTITDEQIASLVDLPMYFIYAETDPTVVPEKHEIPTIERLKEAGAKNLNVATTESVVDLSGNYKDEDGEPFEYNGHWSWIYFFNNESVENTTGLTPWNFIKENVK
ncbi:MAG: hypothetical protein GX675_07420 [Erysipelotrichaceae bacterium]|nr:hypothetical protein [Erysipelotrichaceae bacterium]